MPFGYEYWMVYLLFVNNPTGSTKLRDYSDGGAKVFGQPSLDVLCETTSGRTRFS